MAYRIRPGEELTKALRRIALEQLKQGLRALEASRQTVETRHEARLRLKRMRALLRLQVQQPSKRVRALQRELRDIGRGLAAARGMDVLKATARTVQSALPVGSRKSAGQYLSQRIRELGARAGTFEPVAAAVLAERLRRCKSRFKRLRVEEDALILTGLEAGYRRARGVLRALRKESSIGRRHDLRKQTKELGYQLRLLRAACPSMIDAQTGHLAEMASSLGDDRDLSILGELLTPGPAEAEECLRQIASTRAALEPRIIWLAETAYAERPSAFAARIGVYWRVWRASE